VKGSNILLTGDGACKLCDLGVAAELGPGGKRGTVIGTPLWMSPELITEGEYDEKTDIWSLGITVLELAEQHPPHWLKNPPVRALFLIPHDPSPRLAEPSKWSADLVQFVELSLKKDPKARASARLLRSSAFVNKPVPQAADGSSALMPLVRGVQQRDRERDAAVPPRPKVLGGVDATVGTLKLARQLGDAGSQRAGTVGPTDAAGRTLARPGAFGSFGQGTLGTMLLSNEISITLPPVMCRQTESSNGGTLNGTLLVARSPRPQPEEGGGVSATMRSDYGCGTLVSASGATTGAQHTAGPRRVVLLGFPTKPRASQIEAADASAQDGLPLESDRRSEHTLQGSFTQWMSELASATGDHVSAAIELGSLLIRKPDLVSQWMHGSEVKAVSDALVNANEPIVQGALMAELERTARDEGGRKKLVEAGAHNAVLGIVFTPFVPQYQYVRTSAVSLLALLAESDEGQEALSSHQNFDSLCALARVLNEGESEGDRMHARLVIEMVFKLFDGQQTRTPTPSSQAATRALDRMRNSSTELLRTLALQSSSDDVQQLIASLEKVLKPIERSNTQTLGTFFARDRH